MNIIITYYIFRIIPIIYFNLFFIFYISLLIIILDQCYKKLKSRFLHLFCVILFIQNNLQVYFVNNFYILKDRLKEILCVIFVYIVETFCILYLLSKCLTICNLLRERLCVWMYLFIYLSIFVLIQIFSTKRTKRLSYISYLDVVTLISRTKYQWGVFSTSLRLNWKSFISENTK